MPIIDVLNTLYPNRVHIINNINEFPQNQYMAYILAQNNIAIVTGHGKKERSKIIFDQMHTVTSGHLKAFIVRLHHLFDQNNFERYFIPAISKIEAKEIETNLHNHIGGNTNTLPEYLHNYLFEGITNPIALLILNLALHSSYSGIDDLKKWRRLGLIEDDIWNIISNKLQLQHLNWN